ncbi:hypothetical protein TRIP_C21294 [Candidatus Zixiibacteriota bacterium]|nr:hypothetical protein TRIP_C21294 [candidate division Zixibacteria bacterium]
MKIRTLLLFILVSITILTFGEEQSPVKFRNSANYLPVDTIANFHIITRLESSPAYNRNATGNLSLTGEIDISYRPSPEEASPNSMPEISVDSFRIVYDGDSVFNYPRLSRKSELGNSEGGMRRDSIVISLSPLNCPAAVEKLLFRYTAVIWDDTNRIVGNYEHLLYRKSRDNSWIWITEPPRSNPFSQNTTIAYTVPESSRVMIVIYNVKGQIVDTLVNDMQAEGQYEMEWVPDTSLPGGVYFYKITAGTMAVTKKIVLVK